MNATIVIKAISTAEAAGVRQIWMTSFKPRYVNNIAAAPAKISTVRLGTAIIPIYPIHTLALAQQALAIHDIASGILHLGYVSPDRSCIWLSPTIPLDYMQEYL